MLIKEKMIEARDFFLKRDFDKAIECCKRVLKKEPKFVDAMQLICIAYMNIGDAKEAKDWTYKALESRKDGPSYRKHGTVLNNLGDLEESRKSFLKAIELGEDPVAMGGHISAVYIHMGLPDKAIEFIENIAKDHQNNPEAHWRVGSILRELGRPKEAVKHYKKTIEMDPSLLNIQLDLGMTYLLLGEWDKGWPLFMKRWEQQEYKDAKTLDSPYWQGEDLNNKTIILWCDQGMGDYIHFVRYALTIKEKYPKARVLLGGVPNLIGLLRLVKDVESDQVVLKHPDMKHPHDFNCSLFDIPYILNFKPYSIPFEPYIKSPATEIEDNHFKIGIVFAGSKEYPQDFRRSVFLKQFKDIYDIPGVSFYNLTINASSHRIWPGFGLVKLADAPDMPNIDDPTRMFKHFGITASFIAGLDLVISVDTATAHLTGAMGKPVWTLIPFSCDWRWGVEGDSTFWYPSMKLFRQNKSFDWTEPFQRMKVEIEKTLKERNVN